MVQNLLVRVASCIPLVGTSIKWKPIRLAPQKMKGVPFSASLKGPELVSGSFWFSERLLYAFDHPSSPLCWSAHIQFGYCREPVVLHPIMEYWHRHSSNLSSWQVDSSHIIQSVPHLVRDSKNSSNNQPTKEWKLLSTKYCVETHPKCSKFKPALKNPHFWVSKWHPNIDRPWTLPELEKSCLCR